MVASFRSITVSQLKPTQMTVGMLQVKHKRKRLRQLEKRPGELVDFILVHPIRVVLGPRDKAYVIDHHHLALALLLEKFETAPMKVEHDFSLLTATAFWKKMQAIKCVHPYDAEGRQKPCHAIPGKLTALEDDPYRSLAGFVREAGGFKKVQSPYAEFIWADFYRGRIKEKAIRKHFNKTLQHALQLARHDDATGLPGYIKLSSR